MRTTSGGRRCYARPMEPPVPGREIKALTALRGLAAMAVVLQHFSTTAQALCAETIPSLVPHGYMAVDFFFVLSGFIMSYTYLASFERDGIDAYAPFLVKRVGRLFPLGIVLTFVIVSLGGVASLFGARDLFLTDHVMNAGLLPSIALNVLNLQVFSNAHNINPPSWSISVEMGAYLAFPLLVAILFDARRSLAVVYLLVATALLVREAIDEPRLGLELRDAAFDFVRCFAEFGFGMVTYRVYRASARARRIGEDRWTWLVAAVAAAALLSRLDLLIVATLPFVVLAGACNTGTPSRWLSSRIPYFIGTISFSIYLIHEILRKPELVLFRWLHPEPVSPAVALLFALVGSLTVVPFAALAFYAVENPGRHAIRTIADRLRKPVIAKA